MMVYVGDIVLFGEDGLKDGNDMFNIFEVSGDECFYMRNG